MKKALKFIISLAGIFAGGKAIFTFLKKQNKNGEAPHGTERNG